MPPGMALWRITHRRVPPTTAPRRDRRQSVNVNRQQQVAGAGSATVSSTALSQYRDTSGAGH
jgi:hypothetical protein